MAIDTKYGRVSFELGTIGEDEPVFVFRAQDRMLPQVLQAYAQLCLEAGSPDRHLAAISRAQAQVAEWQDANPIKTPSSDGQEG